jgi:hypothetical protein
MSDTRPSAARRHTRTTEKKRSDELEQGVRITLDGEAYEVRLGDVTSNLARELRRGTGMSLQQLMREITSDPDLDSIASFVWLSRRIAGEAVGIDDVVVTYTQILDEGFDVDLPGEREAADSPEA